MQMMDNIFLRENARHAENNRLLWALMGTIEANYQRFQRVLSNASLYTHSQTHIETMFMRKTGADIQRAHTALLLLEFQDTHSPDMRYRVFSIL